MPYTAEEVAELSKKSTFSLWYEAETNKYYTDFETPDSAIWVFDIEKEESADFIQEMTNVVALNCK